MSAPKDGGPAFPRARGPLFTDEPDWAFGAQAQDGMSLRETMTDAEVAALINVANEGLEDMIARADDSENKIFERGKAVVAKLKAALVETPRSFSKTKLTLTIYGEGLLFRSARDVAYLRVGDKEFQLALTSLKTQTNTDRGSILGMLQTAELTTLGKPRTAHVPELEP